MWNCKCASDTRMLGYSGIARSVWLIWFIWLGSFNQKKPDRPAKPNNDLLMLAVFFSSLLERTEGCYDPIFSCES